MDDKRILGSMAMDLKRAAIGYHRGSFSMAERFLQEAVTRRNEYTNNDLKPYMVRILNQIEKLKTQPKAEIAENALMYSILIQNFVLYS